MPLEISAKQQKVASSGAINLAQRLQLLGENRPGITERLFFTEQLSLLLETGTPLHTALLAIRKHVENAGMGKIIDDLIEDVTSGKSFSYALSKHPDLFPGTYTSLIGAAEEGGFLDKVLLELMNMDEKREELRSTVVSALSYPVFLVTFSIIVVIFVLVVVFPKFAGMFSNIADQLPMTTIVLMNTSQFLISYWVPITAVSIATLIVLGWWLQTTAGETALDKIKLRVIGLRHIFLKIYLIQSLRVLGMAMANGVTVRDALVSCHEVVPNSVFRKFLTDVESKVNEGEGFAAAFQTADFIPPMVIQMVTTGEESGNLPKVLIRVADYYERELAKKLKSFSRMVEPIMLIVMGCVVGLVVSSLILPIFKLSQAVG
jgi:type II secretory pathway component PulF